MIDWSISKIKDAQETAPYAHTTIPSSRVLGRDFPTLYSAGTGIHTIPSQMVFLYP